MSLINRFAICAACLLLGGASLFSQVAGYRLTNPEYRVSGRSSERLLRDEAQIVEGLVFESIEALEVFLADREQVLRNLRVLESADVTYTLGERGADGLVPVAVKVDTVDTWNIVALPYGKFNSNEGLLLSVRARDYNFLGSLEPLKINLDYLYDTEGRSSFGLEGDFTVPFVIFGLDSSLDFSNTFTVPSYDYRNPSYTGTMAFNTKIPYRLFDINVSFSQGFLTNARDDDKALREDWYLSESITAGPSFKLTRSNEPITYTPRLYAAITWRPDRSVDDYVRQQDIGISHEVSYSRVDWIRNHRRGLSYSIKESLYYALDDKEIQHSVMGDIAFYAARYPFGLATQLSGYWYTDDSNKRAGGRMRGILDNRMDVQAALTANIDAPFTLVQFQPSKWFGKKWMRAFDFEGQTSPFIDLGVAKRLDEAFSSDDLWLSGGLELLGYPYAARSFYVRVSVGFDLLAVYATKSLSAASPRDGRSTNEIFIGLGHHY